MTGRAELPEAGTDLGSRLSIAINLAGGEAVAAAFVNKSVKQLKRYISGESSPPFNVIVALAAKAGVTLDWLAAGGGSEVEKRLDEIEAELPSKVGADDERMLASPKWLEIRQELQRFALDPEATPRNRARADLLLAFGFEDPEASGRGALYLHPAMKIRLELDEELNACIVDGISGLYKDEGVDLPAMDLGRLTARLYADLTNAIEDPAERRIGLKLGLEQLRRDLRKPIAVTFRTRST